MKFSLRVNNDSSPADLVKLAVAAEEAGFDQFWFSNDLFLRSAPFLAGMVASNTTRIHFGIGIMNPYSVHPSELAMLAATATEATQGRFMLGLGAGADSFLSWAGLDRAKPLATTRAAILAIKELVRGGKPADHDSHWSSEGYLRFPRGNTHLPGQHESKNDAHDWGDSRRWFAIAVPPGTLRRGARVG